MKVTTDGETCKVETSVFNHYPSTDAVTVEVRPSSMSTGYALYVDITINGKKQTQLLIENGKVHR